MGKSLVLVFALFVVGAVVMAQTHNNMTEKKASDNVTFSSDIRVGTHLLKAGRYQVSCDAKTMKFSVINVGPGIFTTTTKVLELPCQGKELAARSEHTELAMPLGKDGVPVLERLLLKGSNVEHVFPN